MDRADFLSLALIEALVPLAKDRDVVEADNPFLAAYRVAEGDPTKLSKLIVVQREAFLRRWVRQVGTYWDDVGVSAHGRYPGDERPTRRHLALVMWGWSNDDRELGGWVDEWVEMKK